MTIRASDAEPAKTTAFADLLSEVRSTGLLVTRPGYAAWVAVISTLLGGAAAVGVLLYGPMPWSPALATLLAFVVVLGVLPAGLAVGFLAVQLAVVERGRP